VITQSDIKILLTRWGQWSNVSSDIAGIGFKSLWHSLLPQHGCPKSGSSYEVDSDMLAIDSAMQWLKQHSEFDFRMLKLKYRYNYSYNRIAEKLTKELPQYRKNGKKMHNNTAQNYVDLAEQTILKYLQNNC
jgi:hypothetical protein